MSTSDRRGFLLVSGAAAFLAGAPAWAAVANDAAAPRFPGDWEKALTADMAKANVAGAAITVVQDGRLRGFFPYGKASIPFDVPVSPTTRFQIGSVGKHVTVLAVLQLVEAGKLGLDWPIGRAVTGLPDWIAAIPIRDLLGHTGGVPDYENGFAWDRPFPRDVFLAGLKAPAFAPGEAWSYSNSGYVLLGYAIEAASGLSYADYVAQRLFKPAGTPLARPDAAAELIPGRAEPYILEGGQLRHATRMENAVSSMADGGVLFSALDWAPWLQAMASGRLVKPSLVAEMFEDGTLKTGSSTGYGFGWFIDQVRGKPVFYHAGGVPGFVTYVQYYPDQRLLVAATFNSPPRQSLRTLVERAVEVFAPNVTTIGLEPRPQSPRRDDRLRAFLAGGTADDLVLPQVLRGEKANGQDPAKRISGKLEAVDFLESHKAPGGDVSRYRLTINGAPQSRQVGWTPDDRIFLFR